MTEDEYRAAYARFRGEFEAWHFARGGTSLKQLSRRYVTHYVPLPEPEPVYVEHTEADLRTDALIQAIQESLDRRA